MALKVYPSDVSDEEWAFVAPYLTLMTEDAPQRQHDLREVLNALRWMVRSGSPWRYLPHDFPRWDVVYQQTQRWLNAGCFEAMVHDLRLARCVFSTSTSRRLLCSASRRKRAGMRDRGSVVRGSDTSGVGINSAQGAVSAPSGRIAASAGFGRSAGSSGCCDCLRGADGPLGHWTSSSLNMRFTSDLSTARLGDWADNNRRRETESRSEGNQLSSDADARAGEKKDLQVRRIQLFEGMSGLGSEWWRPPADEG